jgi:serine/threonine protein kinase
MTSHIVKTGSTAIIIGNGHYGKFLPIKPNKLIKVTNISTRQNDSKYSDIIKMIPNYSEYYVIPDEITFILPSSHKFYNYLKKLVKNEDINIFYEDLKCVYIDDAGNKELLDTINDVYNDNDFSFWKSYKVIIKFCKKLMKGLYFLHERKICHLDIKPENIMVNTLTGKCKLIDFGFSSKEPFDDYVSNIRGTPCYFPKHFNKSIITPWFPKITANDFIKVDGILPIDNNRKLVYKIDSYCLGRVIYFLKYVYSENITYCLNWEKSTGLKLNKIINSLIDNNIHTRLTVKECIERYFNTNYLDNNIHCTMI